MAVGIGSLGLFSDHSSSRSAGDRGAVLWEGLGICDCACNLTKLEPRAKALAKSPMIIILRRY